MIHSLMGGMHVISASAALLLGLAVIIFPKGGAVHHLLGLAYAFAMLIACISALTLYRMTGHFGLFHVFAVLCLSYVLAGIVQVVLRRPGWLRRHLMAMSWSYLGLLAAAATEAFIRLPMLAHLSNNQTFLLGGMMSAAISLIGVTMMPRWARAALARFGQPS